MTADKRPVFEVGAFGLATTTDAYIAKYTEPRVDGKRDHAATYINGLRIAVEDIPGLITMLTEYYDANAREALVRKARAAVEKALSGAKYSEYLNAIEAVQAVYRQAKDSQHD